MVKKITIDGAGRVVIPKTIRDQHGLHAGRSVEIRTEGERLVLEPVAEEALLAERNGILIITSELEGPPTDHREQRDERLQRLARGKE
jgi:AbrB family looped-hinge helix DNA binding protein